MLSRLWLHANTMPIIIHTTVMSNIVEGKMVTEQLLVKEVYLAAPLALRERRKLRGWESAVYYLQLRGGRMMVLRPVDDGRALGVFHFDKDTCQANTPSISRFALALTKGKTLALNGVEPWPARTNYPEIEAVFACSRELQTVAEVEGLRAAPKVITFNLMTYDELTEVTLINAPKDTYFYATIRGQVFQCRIGRDPGSWFIRLEEMFVDETKPPRAMLLDQGLGPSKHRVSRRQSVGAKSKGSIGPFDRIFSSDKPMTANEIRAHFHIPGRHQARPLKPPATR